MASSIDGRLHHSRWTRPAAGIEPGRLRHYDTTAARLQSEGWMVGRRTMAEMLGGNHEPAVGPASRDREPHLGKRGGRDLAIGFDPRGRLRYEADEVAGDHVVAILGERVPDAYLAQLRATGVSYLFAGPEGDDLPLAMERLRSVFGVTSVLLQGGAIINGAFLKTGLIDAFSLLIYPGIDGLAGVPTIVECPGTPEERPASGQALRHHSTETLDGGMVWLRYDVERAP